ncbi:hypothetical protein L9F63_002625, partial [Diploptera punctata]
VERRGSFLAVGFPTLGSSAAKFTIPRFSSSPITNIVEQSKKSKTIIIIIIYNICNTSSVESDEETLQETALKYLYYYKNRFR